MYTLCDDKRQNLVTECYHVYLGLVKITGVFLRVAIYYLL